MGLSVIIRVRGVDGDVAGVDGGLLVTRASLRGLATQAGSSLRDGASRRGLDIPDWWQGGLRVGCLESQGARDVVRSRGVLGIGRDARGPDSHVLLLLGVVAVGHDDGDLGGRTDGHGPWAIQETGWG